MKKLYTLLFVALSYASFSQVVLNESFNYTVGGNIGGNTTTANDAVGANNWLTHSNTAGNAGTIDVVAGNLTYTGLSNSTGNKISLVGDNTAVPRDINRSITTTATTLYYSMLLKVIDNTQLNATTPNYFFGFGQTAGTTVTSLAARLGITSSNSAANYRLQISNFSGGTATYTENAVDLVFGTTYLVVVKYDRNATPNVASLWVNPTNLGGTEPTTTVTNSSGTSVLSAFASIFFRNAVGTPKAEIDEVRVGESWASVTPTTLGVKQNDIAGLNIYPNPVTNGTLYINTDANAERTVSVFDVLGKQVLKVTTSNNAINVANLNAGVYIVKVTEEGKTATRKLVIR